MNILWAPGSAHHVDHLRVVNNVNLDLHSILARQYNLTVYNLTFCSL